MPREVWIIFLLLSVTETVNSSTPNQIGVSNSRRETHTECAKYKLCFSARKGQASYGELRIRRKATITVKDLNVVRYKYVIQRNVTTVDAPNVLKILRFLPEAVSKPLGLTHNKEYDRSFKEDGDLVKRAQKATSDLVRELRAFIKESDAFLGKALKERCQELLRKIEHTADTRKWPNLTIPSIWDAAKEEWENSQEQIESIKARLHAATLNKPPGIMEEVTCNFRSRKEELTLLVFDLFPPDEAGAEDIEKAVAEERPMVTFVCEPPISFSTGVFVSLLNEEEFDFRPKIGKETGSLKVTDVIGFNNSSSFRVMPGAMVNVFVWQPRYGIDVHCSFGALADFGGEQGTSLEFLLGPSLDIKKSVLFTAGIHVGRVSELQGGFNLGTPKVEGLDSVPIQKSYKVGLGFGISYHFTTD